MLDRVTLTADLDAVAANARAVAAALPGIEIVGVTKCTCGSPEVARAMLAGWAAGDFEIHFPKRFTRFLKLLGLLGDAAYFKIIRRATGL